ARRAAGGGGPRQLRAARAGLDAAPAPFARRPSLDGGGDARGLARPRGSLTRGAGKSSFSARREWWGKAPCAVALPILASSPCSRWVVLLAGRRTRSCAKSRRPTSSTCLPSPTPFRVTTPVFIVSGLRRSSWPRSEERR